MAGHGMEKPQLEATAPAGGSASWRSLVAGLPGRRPWRLPARAWSLAEAARGRSLARPAKPCQGGDPGSIHPAARQGQNPGRLLPQ